MVFKCLTGEAPDYLRDTIQLANDKDQDTRWNGKINFKVPKTKGSNLAERAFSVAGPKLFNALPDELKEAENTESFKKQLKTYLFKQAFDHE